MSKSRFNVSLDQDLIDFARTFAAENRITVADLMTQYLLALKRRVEGEHTEVALSHPSFQKALEDMQGRLRDGSAIWHSYDEVFGE